MGYETARAAYLRGLTFELTGRRRQTPAGGGRMIFTAAWSRQTVAAVAGPVVERGVRRHLGASRLSIADRAPSGSASYISRTLAGRESWYSTTTFSNGKSCWATFTSFASSMPG